MRPSGPVLSRLTPAWRYGLVGGLASIPLTTGLYWLSETANELSLNMVFIGGLIAGCLAAVRSEHVGAVPVGIRTGVVGCLPGIWLVLDTYLFTATVGGPAWFRTVGLGVVVVSWIVVATLMSIIVGVLGAKVGAWLATQLGRSASAVGR
ncbi:DUF5518 domain-containing protein [Haloglomus litoreum]|uniref:DUF5518 domain-containing protein n=1 Tax=Haloglomus litoreum TaxID=3034026 RepID=UPI0023E7C549|nr:DUF5518 domain-containing protein [Haloglomus sp. DT116]